MFGKMTYDIFHCVRNRAPITTMLEIRAHYYQKEICQMKFVKNVFRTHTCTNVELHVYTVPNQLYSGYIRT